MEDFMNRYLQTLLVCFSLFAICGNLAASQTAAGTSDDKQNAKATVPATFAIKMTEAQFAALKKKSALAQTYDTHIKFLQLQFSNDLSVKPNFLKFVSGEPFDINATYGPLKHTLLMGLVCWNQLDLVRQFIALKPEINKPDSFGNTALHIAMANGVDPQIVYALIMADASPSQPNKLGYTPLTYGQTVPKDKFLDYQRFNFERSVQLLLTALKNEAAPTSAAHENKQSTKKDSTANQGLKATQRTTAATTTHNEKTAAENMDAQTIANEIVALQREKEKATEEEWHEEIAKIKLYLDNDESVVPAFINFILGKDFNINATYGNGQQTLLMALVGFDYYDLVIKFLALHPNVNQVDGEGYTALTFGLFNGVNPHIIEALLAAGASVDIRNDFGETPLITACAIKPSQRNQIDGQNFLANIRTLLMAMAAQDPLLIHAEDSSEYPAVEHAIKHYDYELVDLLIEFFPENNRRKILQWIIHYIKQIKDDEEVEEGFNKAEKEARLDEMAYRVRMANFNKLKRQLKAQRQIHGRNISAARQQWKDARANRMQAKQAPIDTKTDL